MSDVRIRALKLQDVEVVLAIDEGVTGVPAKSGDNELWSLLAETTTCFGAELNGRLVGFILADVRPWEFGHRAPVGWIIALGVSPDCQGHGIGKLLGGEVLAAFRRLGVLEVKTLVTPKEADLRSYFEVLGLAETDERVLAARL